MYILYKYVYRPIGDPIWRPNIMGTILWRPNTVSIIEITLWRPNIIET